MYQRARGDSSPRSGNFPTPQCGQIGDLKPAAHLIVATGGFEVRAADDRVATECERVGDAPADQGRVHAALAEPLDHARLFQIAGPAVDEEHGVAGGLAVEV